MAGSGAQTIVLAMACVRVCRCYRLRPPPIACRCRRRAPKAGSAAPARRAPAARRIRAAGAPEAERFLSVLVLHRQAAFRRPCDRVRRASSGRCSTGSAPICRACRRWSADFVQIGPDGRRVEGTFSIQKPGKVRFQYNPPSPIDIIADGSSVVVHDRSLETPGFLSAVADAAALSARRPHRSAARYRRGQRVGRRHVHHRGDRRNPDHGRHQPADDHVRCQDLALKQWTVTDPQGLDTTVAVYNLDTAKKPDPNLFVINYQSNMK